MTPQDMDRLIARHIAAEQAGDTAAAVAVYTDDVVHDVVGAPAGPRHGRAAAQEFYDDLVANIATETMVVTQCHHGAEHCVVEHEWTGTVPGEFLGFAGDGRRITFRMLHVFAFRDGRISRENVWLDGAAIAAQLATPDAAAVAR